MLSGESRPFISETSVRAALDALLYTSTPQLANPLHALVLVDRFLTNPDLPATPDARVFALNRILTGQITEELRRLRQTLGFAPPTPHETLEDALTQIAAAARTGSAELLGWSLLYYRFIRVDFSLAIEMFSAVAHVDERTSRRYQHHAIRRLTERLILDEWNERTQRRKRRLYAELPNPTTTVALFGRDDELAQIQQILNSAAGLRHIFITGAVGTGKTVLTQGALRRQIEADELDHIIWIDQPQSTEYVKAYLAECLLPQNSAISLSEYFLLYHVAVVLDDIGLLLNQIEELEHLLEYASSARVLLTSRTYHPLRNIAEHYSLHDLSKQDACAFIEVLMHEAPERLERIDAEITTLIWDVAGGNPLAIELAVHHWEFFELSSQLGLEAVERLFAHIAASLDADLRCVWLMFALLPPDEVAFQTLLALWPLQADHTHIESLLSYHLLEVVGLDRYRITTSARRYLQQQCRSVPEIQRQVDTLVATMRDDNLDICFDAIEHILLTNWPPVRVEQRIKWMRLACEEGIKRRHWGRWRTILETWYAPKDELDCHLRTALGICLRHLGQWDIAESVFRDSVRQSGQQGLFFDQVRAIIEWCVLLRYRGQYERALDLAKQAERIAAQCRAEVLREAALLEMAHIAIDRKDPFSARGCLASLPDSAVALGLWSEVSLLEQEFQLCREFALRALDQLSSDDASHARLETLIGRSYEQQGDLDLAQLHFALAVTLLERQNDGFALARAQSNLGAVLIRMGCNEEARLLLNEAERIQSQLGDSLALTTTRHNLRILSGRFGS